MRNQQDLMLTIRYNPFGNVYDYPLVGVYARSKEAADLEAAETGDPYDQLAKFDLTIDSAQAQVRLGVFADEEAQDRILRGD